MENHDCCGCIDAASFGLVANDSMVDNSTALQNALAAAAPLAEKVCLPAGVYYYGTTLNIPAGVTIIGVGAGKDPLNTSPVTGSVLAYTGDKWAIEFQGSAGGLRDLAIDDKSGVGAKANGALRILASSALVEDIKVSNVLLMSFIEGTALKLEAVNAGGIPYALFTGLRIRNAKIGIHIFEDETSFTNSNRFLSGVISGGAFETALLVDGGNNNVFWGQVIEPGQSTNGHIIVNAGAITMHELRLEGNQQPAGVPLIQFARDTRGSKLSGFSEGKGLIDLGDNYVDMRSNSIDFNNPGYNQFFNGPLQGIDATALDIPYWEITNTTDVTIESIVPAVLPGHQVLRIIVPAGLVTQFRPIARYRPQILETETYYQASVGGYIRVNYGGENAKVLVTHQPLDDPQPLVSSYPHPGDGQWHFIGLTANILGSKIAVPQFFIDNGSNPNSLTVDITTPTYTFGLQSLPQLESAPITAAGGIINGRLSTALGNITADNYLSGTNYVVLPLDGNTFTVTGTQGIARINHQTADQLPVGTIITLLFDEAGLTVTNSVYIDLYSSYVSQAGSSLTLVSNALGTWRELSRNL